jgi:two-component system, LytTR family, sensor kinase
MPKIIKSILAVTLLSFFAISILSFLTENYGSESSDVFTNISINLIFSFLITSIMTVVNHYVIYNLKAHFKRSQFIVANVLINIITLVLALYFSQWVVWSLGLVGNLLFLGTELFWIVLILSAYVTVFVITYTNLREYAENLAIKLAEQKNKSLNLEVLNKEAQLEVLQSKVNPHFLFNALNSIISIVKTKPVLAEEMLVKLSVLLRKSLNFKTKSMIKLSDELKFLIDYLELEKLRFSNRMTYVVENKLSIDSRQILIPSLLLQPIVENSVKHGIEDIKENGFIKIVLSNTEQKLVINVIDNGIGLKRFEKGFGISSIEERLLLIYGKDN